MVSTNVLVHCFLGGVKQDSSNAQMSLVKGDSCGRVIMKKAQGREVFGLLFLVTMFVLVRDCEAQSKSFFINCGINSSITVSGRRWMGDLVPDNNVTLSYPGIAANTTTLSGESIYEPLYKSARIFSNELNYTFEGIQGSCILRLHFCPFPIDNYDVNKSSFSVVANGLKLMKEFDVHGKISNKNLNLQRSDSNSTFSFSLIKEYILAMNVDVLVIEFIPTKASFGFINAIEIVPVVDNLFADSISKVGGSEANLNLSGRGIETMYRLNVGGPEIEPDQNSDLWRTWEVDSSYMITANAGFEISNSSNITYASINESSVAPLQVYETARTMSNTEVLEKRFNMSWKFEVDPDFDYLIRLHFCELVFDKANQRIFTIYINNRTATDNFDVFVKAGGKSKAYHRDYFDAVSSEVNALWIQLGPDMTVGASGTDALLNGLEIFKLSQKGNLAHVERFEKNGNSASNSRAYKLRVGLGAGVASLTILAVALTLIFCFCRSERTNKIDTKSNSPGWRPLFLHVNSIAHAKEASGLQNANGSVSSTRVGKMFTLAEIHAATNNFDEGLVIGVGGFGKVYKGEIEDGTLAAIKRANPNSEQGLAEFETEIEMLSKLRHRHLVSLIGFCEDQNEMILVYEYMANGTLRSHLFGCDIPPLTWKQRLEACIGAARGLHYLHTGADRGIIHRDIKTTNILLDENFVAKMSDFGLSKTGPALDHSHVSTAVKGSFGYLDPEYFRRQQLTEKSDVYSFGVVLFEVVCARAVINPTLPKDQINLAEWAIRWQKQRSLETIIDPRLKGNYSPESLENFGEIAEKCLADEGKNRPTMGEILWHLEYVLQLHEAWLRGHVSINSSSSHSLGDLEVGEAEEGPPSLDEETSLVI
ncbi:Pkinase_Tyr domain-containing protein/Malectin_like domain-containing protein [Cephalotus follicularis]|uniref:Pkinase_Tyr domain-containing protein/Malectin_like domain-containing protein n=1 Tax=Cephalotus follicularis TaxID=3775 RepID=A0A1Q3BCE5_CEPFO|nr:Pkinase_Tyr domain-containing protein/Malectin_like domain-containing protein [Cephalotus follicularis]